MRNIRPSSIGQLLRRPRRLHPLHSTSTGRARSASRLLVPLPATLRRQFHAEAFLLPPLYFTGLLVALWAWKCLMMIVFQNKIIYMPGLPPNARRERIEDYTKKCWGVKWQEERVQAADGTDLALCVASVTATGDEKTTSLDASVAVPEIYILYFQGNASSIPPRLQDLSWVLYTLQRSERPARYTLVCLSYRGYWTSRGRPSEKGINLDAQAALGWIGRLHQDRVGHRLHQQKHQSLPVPALVLWGQSIGSGVATNLAAWEGFPPTLPLRSLILETPFTSIRDMLSEMYPQKWVPYRHLWPFLRNHLDSLANISVIARHHADGGREKPKVTIVEAGKDELVPADHGEKLIRRCEDVGLEAEKKTVRSAFHNSAVILLEGRKAVADAIEQVRARI
ncbi:Monoacylglycerol lipase ABHD12 [Colletotrichum sidae]|uniref:Monoacylglycerol lipase ABHD12 n=1 Tax=Colletotrichum sidae TaxID=1347389 RepID=A0A4R8T4E9_9PEZI|nr:Monoacylglycerol lipase ABHD12 [Colletotrichum sidae]